MQKAHSNINWENLPSKNTPLGAYLLNKQDREIDVIDDRVLSLYGYEGRVAQSEKNAKASETNAKTSETNAKQSELKAKEYMEKAFAGTPEGYDSLVDTVYKMDIKETTETTLENSKAGGYKLLSMIGKSEQKTYNGNQLANFPDVSSVQLNGVTWSCKNGVVSASGTSTATSGTLNEQVKIYYYLPIIAGTYIVSGGKNYNQSGIGVFARITKFDDTVEYVNSGSTFTLDGTEKACAIYCQVAINNTVNTSVKPMVNKGTTALPYEPYVGGIPSPNPNYTQSLNYTGDCVEMIQGNRASTTGAYQTSTISITSVNPIPCSGGDVIKISTDDTNVILPLYFNENGFVSSTSKETDVAEFTVPSGVTYFHFDIRNANGITPETVGKISLTINGKYVVQIVENGKNQLDCRGLVTTTANGGTFTPIYDNDGNLLYVNVNGTFTADTTFYLNLFLTQKVGEKYTLTGCPSGGSMETYFMYVQYVGYDVGNGTSAQIFTDRTVNARIKIMANTTCNNLKFYPMLRYYNITDDTYEPYKETVATVLLNAPLCETDVMRRTEVARKKKTITLNGTEGITWRIRSENAKHVYASPNSLWSDHDATIIDGDLLSNRFVGNNSIAEGHIWFSSNYLNFVANVEFTSSAEVNSWLASNPIELEYELAEEVIETLDTDSQIALNSLETFDTVTYINVDSRVKSSEIKGEYGTSNVGALALENENLHNIVNLTTIKGGVANNLSTTKDGFVLDARQGKVLNEKIETKQDAITIHTYTRAFSGSGLASGDTKAIITNSISSMFPNYNASEEIIIGAQAVDEDYTYSSSLILIPHIVGENYMFVLAHNFSSAPVTMDTTTTIKLSLITIPK